MKFRRTEAPEDPLLTQARKRVARMSPTEAREYRISLWAYAMRVDENPTEHPEDDHGEIAMVLAAAQAIHDRLNPAA